MDELQVGTPPAARPAGSAAGSPPAGSPAAGSPPAGAAGVACSLCGITAPSAPLSWMYELDRSRGRRWYCPDCSRQHLRAVEAKLDPEWW